MCLLAGTVLLSIQALLSAPNPDDPLANDVADHWKSDEPMAIKTGAANPLLQNTDWPLMACPSHAHVHTAKEWTNEFRVALAR